MKTLSAALQAHLSSGVTTMAYCWRVTRRDGIVLGFTEHDNPITYAGTVFEASAGFTASKIDQGLNLSIDNMEAVGALSSASITDTDIMARRYDDAIVELFWVNWADPTAGVTIAGGNLGELKREGLTFSAEFRSIANRLNQKIGYTYERYCSAQLGDTRCGINLAAAAYTGTATAATAGTSRLITVSGLSGFAADWFTDGTLTFSSGQNNGIACEIKTHLRTSGIDVLELWLPPPFSVAVGDTGAAVAGCRKSFAVCSQKFANQVNFRGFPQIPGADVVTRYGVQGALGQTGGSLFGAQ